MITIQRHNSWLGIMYYVFVGDVCLGYYYVSHYVTGERVFNTIRYSDSSLYSYPNDKVKNCVEAVQYIIS